MELFIHVLTDVLHLSKIIIFCDFIFRFRKREENKNRNFIFIFIMFSLSILFYSINESIVTSLTYIIVLCLCICLIYDEKIYELIISGVWIIFLTSMLDLLFTEMVTVLFDMLKVTNEGVGELTASAVSLLFVLVVGQIYKNKYKIGIKNIGFAKLFLFTILATADAFVIMSLGTILVDDYKGKHKVLFLILFLITIIGIFIQLASVILLIISRDTYKEKEEITGKYLNEQIKHYKYLEQREKDTKKFRHDIKSHMQVLSSMAKNDMYSNFDEYMKDINIKIDSFGNVITVNNGIVDAIVNKYYSEATQKGIDIVIKGMFPKNCKISAYDLCTIFSNLLSNAIEAAEKSVEKRISMECRYTKESIIVITKNTFKDEGQFRHSKIITTKKDVEYHGFGIENIKDAVMRNNGMIDIDIENSIYSITVMLANQEVES